VREEAAVTLAPGADPERVARAIAARMPDSAQGQAIVTRPSTLRALRCGCSIRSFAVTYVLEVVAVLVGLAGVAATMSAQTVARAREFGMLRHIGASPAPDRRHARDRGRAARRGRGRRGDPGRSRHEPGPDPRRQSAVVQLDDDHARAARADRGRRRARSVAAAAGTAMLAGRRAVSVDAVRAVGRIGDGRSVGSAPADGGRAGGGGARALSRREAGRAAALPGRSRRPPGLIAPNGGTSPAG
jgi:putative ABC transport system permease protein